MYMWAECVLKRFKGGTKILLSYEIDRK